MKNLKAYMGYSWDPGNGAVLIFAETAKRAKLIGYPIIRSWTDAEWIDMRANFLKDLPAHLKELNTGLEQVIENPPACSNCEMWGHHLCENGRCQGCESEDD